MGADATAAALIPDRPSVSRLREAAAGCRACELWRKGTQTVFGEGSPDASVMLVGEQPGDREDLSGRPFVGPAGALLDRALAEAGIPRHDVYLVVDPQVLVLLGATAAQSLLGRDFSVTEHRGEIADSSLAPVVMATVHPSSILRARDSAARHAELEAFVRDLRVVAGVVRR